MRVPICYSLVLIAFVLFASLWRLDSVPPVWWDEGWTLSIARNWFETGHYVRLLEGQGVPPGLGASPVVTAAISLSFRMFGIGVIQARMVGVVVTLLSLSMIYLVARHLYNQPIALGAVLVLVCLPSYVDLFPPYLGRQVLGEMPALFFLLAGHAAILGLGKHPVRALAIAIVAWAIALSIKLQLVPFWIFSMFVTMAISLYRRDWLLSSRWGMAILGSLIGSRMLATICESILQSKTDITDPITGLYQVTATVASIPSRMFALIVTALFGIPTFVGLCYGLWKYLKSETTLGTNVDQAKLSLLLLASTWFGWFVLFSVGWTRYVFPPIFIGSIFVSAMIHDLTRGFDIDYTIRQSLEGVRGRGFNKQALGALFVVLVIVTSVPRTAMALYKAYVLDGDNSAQQTAEFLNSQTRSNALIETYDSELFFFLDRPYHYPPDQVHVQLIRRTFLYEDSLVVDYDPLEANPDYLVVGPHSKQWRLYDSVLATGAFRLLRTYKRYQIYERLWEAKVVPEPSVGLLMKDRIE